MTPRNEKRFKTITALQDKAWRKMRSVPGVAPGSYIDFNVAPTITAIGPLSNITVTGSTREQDSLANPVVMDMLSVDFARVLKDLTVVMNDLQKLSGLGGLPLSLPDSATLRVRFPGCDADTVNRLCEELGIRRGLVYQDEAFDSVNGAEMALLFPFAPGPTTTEVNFPFRAGNGRGKGDDPLDWRNMLSPQPQSSPKCSTCSVTSHDWEEFEALQERYSTPNGNGEDDIAPFSMHGSSNVSDSMNYEGLEGIYRFLEECNRARG